MRRVLTSLALVPFVVYVMLWGPRWLLAAVVGLAAAICWWEYCGIAAARTTWRLTGAFAGLLVLAAPLEVGFPVLTILALAGLVWPVWAGEPPGTGLARTAVLFLGILYIFGAWRCALLLYALNPACLAFAVVLNWAGDVFAFYAGRSLGRHKLAPGVSPNKSWEGAAASLAASVIFGIVYLGRFLPGMSPLEAALLSAMGNVAAQIGDLAESALKRGAGVKDSGALLPGHGGLLDRVDGTLFAMPVIYVFLRRPGLV